MFKPIILSATILSGALLLTGCTSSLNDSTSTTDGKSYGVFKDFSDKAIVKDDSGEYMATQLNENSKANIYDVARTMPDFYRYGFTDADGKTAQDFITKFVASEGLDSISLDSKNANKWVETNFDTYLGGPYADELRKDIASGDSQYSFLVEGLPLTVRDSKPRIKSSSIHVNQITASKDDKGSYLEIYGTAIVQYRASEKNILAYAVKANESQKLDEATITAVYPKLKDGKEETIDEVFNFHYFLQKIDGKWKIVNYNNASSWQIESMRADNASGAEASSTATPTPTK